MRRAAAAPFLGGIAGGGFRIPVVRGRRCQCDRGHQVRPAAPHLRTERPKMLDFSPEPFPMVFQDPEAEVARLLSVADCDWPAASTVARLGRTGAASVASSTGVSSTACGHGDCSTPASTASCRRRCARNAASIWGCSGFTTRRGLHGAEGGRGAEVHGPLPRPSGIPRRRCSIPDCSRSGRARSSTSTRSCTRLRPERRPR